MSRRTYRFKTKPWVHQLEALKRALQRPGFALLMEQRTGKSKVAIDWFSALSMIEGIDRVLIVCPYGVMGRWHLELERHMPNDIQLDIKVTHYKALFDREYGIDPENPRAWGVVDNEELMRWALRSPKRLAVVVDESTEISNPNSAIHKRLFRIVKDVPRVLIMTGTPFHKKPVGIFGQFKMIDPSIFGTNYGVFKRRYTLYYNFRLIRYLELEDMAKRIAPVSFQVKEKDCWDIPRARDEIVPIKLEESADAYKTMVKDAIIQLGDHTIEAPLAITLALRLHQITGGYLRNSAGRVVPVGREKARAYGDLLEEILQADRHKIVTFARFRPEIAACARVAQARKFRIILLHGKVKGEERDRRIAQFEKETEPTVFISQVATGSMGLELSCASDEIFYSLTNSLLHYDQARSRIRGHKQKNNMTYWHLLMDNTIDPAMYMALRKHRDIGKMIMDHPEVLTSSFSKRV